MILIQFSKKKKLRGETGSAEATYRGEISSRRSSQGVVVADGQLASMSFLSHLEAYPRGPRCPDDMWRVSYLGPLPKADS